MTYTETGMVTNLDRVERPPVKFLYEDDGIVVFLELNDDHSAIR